MTTTRREGYAPSPEEPLTEAELTYLREALAQSTPGPWETTVPAWGSWVDHRALVAAMSGRILGEVAREADARFILFAHEFLPRLLAEVERRRRADVDGLVDDGGPRGPTGPTHIEYACFTCGEVIGYTAVDPSSEERDRITRATIDHARARVHDTTTGAVHERPVASDTVSWYGHNGEGLRNR